MYVKFTLSRRQNNTVLWSLKDCSQIYQVLVHIPVKKKIKILISVTPVQIVVLDFVESLVCKQKC